MLTTYSPDINNKIQGQGSKLMKVLLLRESLELAKCVVDTLKYTIYLKW